MYTIKQWLWAGCVAQEEDEECLPSKYIVLSSNCSTSKQKTLQALTFLLSLYISILFALVWWPQLTHHFLV
jgi:hypothetical protein